MSNNQSQNRLARAVDWEDALAVLDVCDNVQGSVVSVAGAADIALSLLTKSFRSLTVVASNQTERMLFELKFRAIQSLHPDNVYNLLGIHPGGRRVFVYHQLREVLSEEARLWWDRYEDIIREGVIESGQQERRHQHFKRWMNRLRLNVEKIPINSLRQHKRWALLEPLLPQIIDVRANETFWQDDNPYAHMLLHQQWNVYALQSGALSLSYEGMESIQRSNMELLMVTGSLKEWMDTETSETFSVLYLGSLIDLRQTQNIGPNFWNQVSNRLSDLGKVLCWSLTQPATSSLRWQKYEERIRSVHSGVLWIGERLQSRH